MCEKSNPRRVILAEISAKFTHILLLTKCSFVARGLIIANGQVRGPLSDGILCPGGQVVLGEEVPVGCHVVIPVCGSA